MFSGELGPFLVVTMMEDCVEDRTVGGVEGKEGKVTLGGMSVIFSCPSLFLWYSSMYRIAIASRQTVIMPTRHRIAPCIQAFLNIEPSLLLLLEDLYCEDVEETLPLPFPVDLMEPNLVRFDILTVWVSSSSIRCPRLSVTLLSSLTAPMFSSKMILNYFVIKVTATSRQ